MKLICLPTVSWKRSWVYIVLALSLLTSVALPQPKGTPATPEKLDPAVAAQKGRERVAALLAQEPAQSVTNKGILRVQEPNRTWRQVPVRFAIATSVGGWISVYEADVSTPVAGTVKLVIRQQADQPSRYELTTPGSAPKTLAGNETMIAFAGSDYWLADFGLEFFHWPKQLFIKNEISRGQSCDVLESLNPQPAPGAYARVLTWVDVDSGGIVKAEAYDSNNRLLKTFLPKNLQKVNGEWRVQEMEIRNRQAGTRSVIEFQR